MCEDPGRPARSTRSAHSPKSEQALVNLAGWPDQPESPHSWEGHHCSGQEGITWSIQVCSHMYNVHVHVYTYVKLYMCTCTTKMLYICGFHTVSCVRESKLTRIVTPRLAGWTYKDLSLPQQCAT